MKQVNGKGCLVTVSLERLFELNFPFFKGSLQYFIERKVDELLFHYLKTVNRK